MAASRLSKTRFCLLLLSLACLIVDGIIAHDEPLRNWSTNDVPQFYVHRALNFLNDITPNGHTYKNGSLIAAQIMEYGQTKIYRLTFKLEPVCKDNDEPCPHDFCTLEAYTTNSNYYEAPFINKDSVHFFNLPAKKKESNEEQQVVENVEKQIINESVSLDREVQISADHNDRPFVAVKANRSEYCPGCPYELNPSLPGLTAFGEQVLQSMDEAGVSDFKHKLISIVRVTRAVPPSSNVIQYQLYMEIGESSCLRTSLIEVSECPLQSNLPIKLCMVTFEERPWQTGSRRITKNNCTDSLLNNDNEVSASVDPNAAFIDSVEPNRYDDSTKTEFYDQIAQEAQEVFRVPSMEVSTAKELPHANVILDGASGTPQAETVKLDGKMKEFDEFLDDFDLAIKTETTSPKNLAEQGERESKEAAAASSTEAPAQSADANEEVQISQNPALLPTVESRRSKRSLGKKTNKAGLRKLAIKVVEMIDEHDEDNKKKHVIEVVDSSRKPHSQDIFFHLTIEVAPTDCPESEVSTECLDEVIPGPTEICQCDVLTSEKKPYLAPKLLHYSCKNKEKAWVRLRRGSDTLLGAQEVIDKNDDDVKQFVNLGLRKYSQGLEGTREPLIHEIKEVTRQVVAGYKYKIKVDFGLSSCEKGITENCKLDASKGLTECVIEVWTRPWLKNTEPEIELKCSGSKKKRSLKGQNYSAKMLDQFKDRKLFYEFMAKYDKVYASAEEREKRYKIFKKNLAMIEELRKNEQGTGRYDVTMSADLTNAEFKANYLGFKHSLKSDNDIPMPKAEIPDIELPAEYDWRHYNVVTPVKNQGQCGSCWAFSVTGNIEGQYAIKHNKLISFSEQELMDCDTHDDGCNGGLPDNAYRAIEELGGLETETDYPYDARDEKCHFNKTMAKVTVVSGLNITSNETQMAQWLVKNGPMSIGINANAMQFYIGGISHPFHFLCNPNSLDHGVLIVGYGVKSYPIFKKTLPYWTIKNSWGPHWGEQGYYRIYRGDGSCGINKMVTSAVIA